MINLADLDDSSPYLGQLKETAGPVTIVNTQLRAAFGTPEFARHMKRYPDGTVAYPHLYQKAAVEGICEGE